MQLIEVARFETEINRPEEVLVTSNGDTLVVRDIGEVETWEIPNRRLLWKKETGFYDHHLPSDDTIVWLDQSQTPNAIAHANLRTGDDQKRTALDFEPVRLWNAVFGWGDSPVLAAQVENSDDPQIVTFSVETGEQLSRIDMPRGHAGVQGLGVSPDAAHFLVTTDGGVLWCDQGGTLLHEFETNNHVTRLLFLPKGKSALACGDVFGSPLYFLDFDDRKVVEHSEHRWEAVSLDVSADGKWAVTGGRSRFAADRNYYQRTNPSEGGEIVVWNLAANRVVAKLNPFVDSVEAVGISQDGRWIAAAESGDSTGRVVVFEMKQR